MRNIPNLFVIGAPKSGTTAFVSSLKDHPDIFVPELKEPRFFDAHTFYDFEEDYPINDLPQYLKLYDSGQSLKCKYRVDGSVFNMYSNKSLENILNLSPESKFIIILRDPLSATKSMFSQRMKYTNPLLREVSVDFDKCWKLMKERHKGKNFPKACRNKILFRYDLLFAYEKYLPFIINTIKPNNLHIASYSEFKNNPDVFYKEICSFLDISEIPSSENKAKNVSFHIKPSLKIKIVGFIISKTIKFRKNRNFNGRFTSQVKNYLLSNKHHKPQFSNDSDTDIKKFFKPTYSYLKSKNIKL